ncbi:MAG: MBL fold metallo-hydrolase, partial [Chitinophagia bacterium]|nr:MBL fold metallo-hydrolase [Chitinophagia bacterium]
MMKLTILGNNSALPAFGRHPTAQALMVGGETILIDCGEGCQAQMQKFGIKWRRLRHIFISHLHGDHYFGLPGLVNSMSLLGRTEPLNLYAPAPLEGMLQQMLVVADSELSYPLHFHALPEGDSVLFESEQLTLTCFPVQHRIQCHGLVVTARSRYRRILPEVCAEYGVPVTYFEQLKDGADFVADDGGVVSNTVLTAPG